MAVNKVVLSGETLIDLTNDTVTAADVASGVTFHLPNGEQATGTSSGGGGSDGKFAALVDGSITTVAAEDLAGVTSIRDYMFQDCTSLTSITIPSSVTSLGQYVFDGCTSLTSITIPSSVTSLGQYAFYGCTSLESVTISDSLTSLGQGTFQDCTSLTSITIPSSVTRFGYDMFDGCTSLESVTLPDSLTEMGSYTFQDCTSLTSIMLPDSLTDIGAGVFDGCTSLTSIVIPDGVTRIGFNAFNGCTSLTSITIPSGVVKISSVALQIGSITNKATITMLPTTPPTIQRNTFNASRLNQIIVPAGTGDTYKAATNWANFADYIVEATNNPSEPEKTDII